MIHRHWCGRCRNVTNVNSSDTGEQHQAKPGERCKCGALLTYLESVYEETDERAEPSADRPRKPPSREEWYDAGYAAGTYERRFAGPEWLPCWSDPNYVATRTRVKEDGSLEPVTEVSSLGAPGMQSGESFDAEADDPVQS